MADFIEGMTRGYALGEAIQTQPMRRQEQALQLQKLGMEVEETQKAIQRREDAIRQFQTAANPDDTVIEQSVNAAQAMFAQANYEAGAEILQKTADLQNKQADLALKEREQRNTELDQALVSFTSINSQEDKDKFFRYLAMTNPELMEDEGVQQLAQAPFTPELKAAVVGRIYDLKDQAEIEAARARAAASRAQAAKDTAEIKELIPARAEAERARAEHYEKAGGVNAKGFKDLAARITTRLEASYARPNDPATKARLEDMGFLGARRVQERMEEDETVTEEEAIDSTVIELARTGYLAGLTPKTPGRGSRTRPIEMARDPKTGVLNVTPGQWVTNPKTGAIGFYTGQPGREILTPEEFDAGER